MADEIVKAEGAAEIEKPKTAPKESKEGHDKKKKKQYGQLFKRFSGFAGGVLLGLILGVGGSIALSFHNPPDDPEDSTTSVDVTVLQGRIAAASELTSAKQGYTVVEKVEDTSRFFDLFDIPWTTNSFILVYSGEVHAGVDLSFADVALQGTEVIVRVPPAKILANDADEGTYRVLDEKNNVLNPIHVEDVTNYLATSQATVEKSAAESDVLAEAQANAEEVLRTMLETALPEGYTVRFELQEEE